MVPEKILQELGFSDEKDFLSLVSGVDITTTEKITAFKNWQDNDGSKSGLLKLDPYCRSGRWGSEPCRELEAK